MPWVPTAEDTPYARLGGRDAVIALAQTFYDVMERDEVALARLHPLDADGRIVREARDRFALFLVGWLGGPQDYVAPRASAPPHAARAGARDIAMRDAWVLQRAAMEAEGVDPDVRAYLDARFAEVADFMRNAEG
ncbi:MAG: cyanoglobin [Polyangiaceae bacterium]